MKKETCCEYGKKLMIDEMEIYAKCQKKWDDEDKKYVNCKECTPLGYYLTDGFYISRKSAHNLGLI
ncbi:MAG: hypothetical protein JRJ85_08105 [Deltaproteobacteria bacterium]|nr:hypothetical protein [Deltaproteobacteria bacterium]